MDESFVLSGRDAEAQSGLETGSLALRKNCRIPRRIASEAQAEETGKAEVAAGQRTSSAGQSLTAKANAGRDSKSSQANRRSFGIAGEPDARNRKEWP
jgi:hypothetical protein